MRKPLWKTVEPLLKNLDMYQPNNSAIQFLDIDPREMKAFVQTKTC